MEINNTAIVMIYKGELSNDFNILNEYNIVIITEIISLETAETLNQYCRMKKIGFIYTSQLGLSSFLFTDFGEDFIIEDMSLLEPDKYYIKSISNSCPGIVTIDPIENNLTKEKNFLKIGTGDFISFREVKGMTELNDTPPRPVRVIDKIKFTIEDTTKFQEFTGSGIAEEIKVPRPGIFKPLSEAINVIYYEDVIEEYLNEDTVGINCRTSSDLMNDDVFWNMGNTKKMNSNNIIEEEKKESIPWIKMFYEEFRNESLKSFVNEKMHLAFLTIHEFFNIHQDLPGYNNIKDINECINISLKILSKAKDEGYKWAVNLQKIDKPFLENIYKYSRFNYTPFTNFFGGIVSEEILKFTGILKPSSQWVYFNFYSLLNPSLINSIPINKDNKEENKDNENSDKDIDIVDMNIFNSFNIKLTSELKKINILIIGLNDVAYEILKIFIMLNILNTKDNKIIIISTEDYEIKEKLKDLTNYDKNKNINIIKENINNIINLEEKDWWNKSEIIIDTLNYDYYSKEKFIIIEKAQKNNKKLITINAKKYNACSELILPQNNTKKELCLYKEEETPKGNDNSNNNNNIIIKDDDDNYENYKNLSCIEEALIWSENLFKNNFIKNIKYLNEIIEKSNSEGDKIIFIDEIFNKEKEQNNNDDDINIQLIKNFKKLITLKLGMNYETIVFYSIELFEDLFSLSTEKILAKFPSDLLLKGKNEKFWSGNRKEPKKISFDINNEEHYELIYCMTYLFCKILKIQDIDKKMLNIKKIIEKYEPKKPDTLNIKKIKLKEYSYIEKFSLVQFLRNSNKENLEFIELDINYKKNLEDFDNLENINKQLQFLILASNIKLSIYGLNQNNKNDTICKILKINMIHPSAAACIAGAVVMQISGLIFDDDNDKNNNEKNEIVENGGSKNEKNNSNNSEYKWRKNCVFNLGNNIYLIFDSY